MIALLVLTMIAIEFTRSDILPHIQYVPHSLPFTSQPHGRAWKIHNKDLLISDVVPRYFVQSKYQSFARQLNGWGFKRLHQAGNDFNAYYHECFLRGMPQLAVLMKRVSPKQGRLLPHLEGEPNFYEEKYSTLPPLGARANQPPHPPSPMEMGPAAGYAYPQAPPTDYYSSPHPPSDFSAYHRHGASYPPFIPQPLFYGHPDETHAAATYAPNMGYPSYHPYYPMPYAPREQYPHFYHHPPGTAYGAESSGYHDASSSRTTVKVKSDEARASNNDPASFPEASFSSPRDAIDVQSHQNLADVEVTGVSPYAPPEQYPHFYHHPPGTVYGAESSGYDFAPPSSTTTNDPASFLEASFSSPRDAIDVQGHQNLADVDVMEVSSKPSDCCACDDGDETLQDE